MLRGIDPFPGLALGTGVALPTSLAHVATGLHQPLHRVLALWFRQ